MSVIYVIHLPARMLFIYEDLTALAFADNRQQFDELLAHGYLPVTFYEDLAKGYQQITTVNFVTSR